MSTLALPKSSRTTVVIAIIVFGLALYHVATHTGADPFLAVAAFLLSAYLADLFTGFAHFGFDYVFPDRLPILGPVAKEFREHHDRPTLDPADYVVNLSKGAYCSLPVSLLILALCYLVSDGWGSFLLLSTLLGMSLWGFFFHQIHSYAHMGSLLPPDEFKARVEQISRLQDQAAQVREFDKLFETVPIPRFVRLLQRYRLILNPGVHNLHHISFETDFSSVNGWSDPISNLILRPIARRLKSAEPNA